MVSALIITNANQSQEVTYMILTIADLFSADDLAEIRKDLALVQWRDGAETAGATAKAVKRNEQADLSSRAGTRLKEKLGKMIESHPVLLAYARPAQFTRLLISRTRNGGGYGHHVDNPFMDMGGGKRVRTDLSFTLFLNEPDDYEGGDLSIELAGVTHRVKEKAGDLVIYPSTTLHAVEPVTSGERLVCIGWIESLVRSGEEREILFDLENLKAELASRYDANSPEMLILSKTSANLKRMWMKSG